MITNEILKAALLGTEKYMPQPYPSISETADKIAAQSSDKEDRFLKQAAVTLLYKEAGSIATKVTQTIERCPEEPLPIIADYHNELLKTALTSKDEVLFQYLIFVCNQKKQVVAPELSPLILNKALEHKKQAQPLLQVCGVTGKWLCGLNKEWQLFLDDSTEENVWETGNLENRKEFLTSLRQTDATAAITLLEKSIQTENATNRQAFVELLKTGLSINDETFLDNLLNDKSQKVKDAAIALLKNIQGSRLNNSYLDQVLTIISIKEERHLLITKKKVLHIEESIQPDEALIKTGIQRVSSEKGVKDAIFILGQLLTCIDPVILAIRLKVTDVELIKLLLQHNENKTLLPFVIQAAIAFKNKAWAKALLESGHTDHVMLLDALDETERTDYYKLFLEKNLHALLSYVLDNKYQELSLPLSESLLEQLRLNPYTITQPYYQLLALHLPAQVLPKLTEYSLDNNDHYQAKYFRNQVFEMMRMLEVKQQIK